MELIMLLLIAQGIVLSFLLLFRKRNRIGNKYLAAFVFSIIMERSIGLLEVKWPLITSEYWIFPFAIGKLTTTVFLYLYICKTIKITNSRATLLITLSSLIPVSLGTFMIMTKPVISFDDFVNSSNSILSSIITMVWSSFFIIKAILLLHKNSSSSLPGVRWLVSLIIIITLTLLIKVIDDVNEYFELTKEVDIIHLVDVGLLVIVYLISYKVLATPTLFYSTNETMVKYSGSSLSEERLNNIQSRLQIYMDKEKPYLKGSLTIQNVADSLGFSRQYISQVLNEKMQLNFNDYLNQHRVNEFKNKLNNPAFQHYTILALALESGFNSKTSFNTIFKRHTGNTPSEYKKLLTVNQDTKRSD